MNTDKYKQLVEQRIRSTFDEWTSRTTVEEREIYRFLHNIKGTAGTIGMLDIEKVAEQKINLYSDENNRQFTYLEWYEQLKSLLEAISADKGQGQLSEGVTTTQNLIWEKKENRILIIDDDAELAGYLKEILEGHNYPVNIALTAERGLKLFYDWKPDMILLDILLPDRNGLELLKQIVEKTKQDHSTIIVMSSIDTRENQLHAYRSGAMDYIPKPIDQELMIALIENRFRTMQHWEHLIIVDELTGAYNRKYFNQMMKHLIADFHRSGRVFTIVIIDLDYFKKVNDTYGHLVGDEVLRRCADTIMKSMRHEDILCRYGGEEFALLLPNTDKNQAREVLERIHQAFSSYMGSFDDQQLQVTFTAGITDIHLENAHSEKLFEEADQALYVGKQSGRNQTVLFSPEVISKHNEQTINIIVVDDDRLIRNIVVSEFSKWQPNRNIVVSIKEYENGTDFLQSDWYSEHEKYVILLDGIMPEMDGVEVLKRIRYEYPESNIVVAMLTGRSNQTDIIHALQLGADDYIVKPFQMSELVSRIERLVQKICRK